MIPFVFDPTEPPSPRLVHFVGRPRGGADPLPADVAHLVAEVRLASILDSGQLRAFAVHGTDVPVIGASDISPADLEAALRTGLSTRGPFEPWALVLNRDLMWGSGARPVLYADYVDLRLLQQALEGHAAGRGALVQRLDLNMYRSDWTHEREWRWLARATPDHLPVWPQLDAVIVGRTGWQPPSLEAHPDATTVERWWWTGKELVDDGKITEPSPYD